ncbi:MAG: hypothetical protein MRJ65_11335 [Candidatus Brocadiaceae bacterium]|nr:hypothetical protein [Candidatus Brocadiaceae bacterium]
MKRLLIMSMNKYFFCIGLPVLIVVLNGCEETQIRHSDYAPFKSPVSLSTTTQEVERKAWEYEVSPEADGLDEKKEGIGQKEFIYPQEYNKPEPALVKPGYKGDKVNIAFNFDNAELKDVLHIILGEILKENYILDNRVGGKINLHATGQVYKEELLSMLNTLLYIYNFAIVKEGNLYRVLPKAEARRETNIVIHGDKIPQWSHDIIVQIVPLQYGDPGKLSGTLKQFMTGIGNVVAQKDSQYLIIVEDASNIEKLLTIIKTFDVPFFAGKALKFYEFKHVDAKNMAKDLVSFAKALGASVGDNGEFNFIPFSDTNKLLAVTRLPELLPQIDLWINNIDVPPMALDEKSKVFIYKVQHQKAETILAVLTQMYREEIAAQPKFLGKEQIESMKIVTDPETNSIVVKSLPSQYKGLKAIIEALDATPQQVFIEVLIIEVDLNDTLQYNSSWSWDMGSLKLKGLGELQQTSGVPSLSFSKSNYEILLDIVATNSNTRILSAPHILVRDEQPASIQVGNEVPILSSSGQQSGTTVTFEQVQYRDTGIILTVTPHIAENGFITLDVNQEVSNAETTTTGVADSPTFTTRQAETSLVIKSGHTISLGGIIEQKTEKSISKIPVLGDIPLLGYLFKSIGTSQRRTELIMLITPYIANTAEEADSLTSAFQKKLRQIEPLLVQSAKL